MDTGTPLSTPPNCYNLVSLALKRVNTFTDHVKTRIIISSYREPEGAINMGFKNILVPYDNSVHAENALKEAIGMANGDPEATIHVVEVAAPPQDLVYSSINQTGFGMGVSTVSKADFASVVEQRNEEDDEKLQKNIAELVKDFPGNLTAEVIFGIYTIETIIDAAKHYECDLIVMGSRGLGAIRGAIGSVSYGVLRSSDIPVLVVK